MNPSLILLLVGLVGGLFAGHWKPLAFLAPKPPTAQLTALQSDLQKAKDDAAAKDTALKAAHDAEQARLTEQLRVAQQMSQGASTALGRVPAVHITPELTLGQSLLLRSNVRLATAIGKLPEDMQAEILAIVDQALSSVQAERDAAQAALVKKDADFQAVTAEREQIKAQIPVLAAKAQAAETAKAQLETAVTAKTEEVKQAADKLDAKAREAGSLTGALTSLWHWIVFGACAYAFLAFILPAITGVMPSGTFKNFLRHVSGFTLNPIHHADAVATINNLKTSLTQPKT